MSHHEHLLTCEIINNKFVSICYQNRKCMKKELKDIKCLIPIDSFNMKYEQTGLLIGSNGIFYFSVDAGEYGYDLAQCWYDEIMQKISQC